MPVPGAFGTRWDRPGRERELSHARVSKQGRNSQSRLLNKEALSRAGSPRRAGSNPAGAP